MAGCFAPRVRSVLWRTLGAIPSTSRAVRALKLLCRNGCVGGKILQRAEWLRDTKRRPVADRHGHGPRSASCLACGSFQHLRGSMFCGARGHGDSHGVSKMWRGWARSLCSGSLMVHVNAGIAGLVCCIVLGKRTGYGTENMAPHGWPTVWPPPPCSTRRSRRRAQRSSG